MTTYYCEKCGHKLDENERRCAFCGAVQKRLSDQEYDTKKCKKCGKEIYVNVNFCPYCGTDQAILNLDEDLKKDNVSSNQNNNQIDQDQTPQQKLAQGLMNTNLDDQDSINEFMKQMQDAGIKVRVIKPEEKNETGKPGLVASTKLLIRDMFKINKRLGVNDFWWGFLGLLLIFTGLAVLIVECLPLFGIHLTNKMMIVAIFSSSAVFQLSMVTAVVRRLHDIKIPGWFGIFWFISLGHFILLLLCLMGPRLDDNPYTFNVEDWKKRQNKL